MQVGLVKRKSDRPSVQSPYAVPPAKGRAPETALPVDTAVLTANDTAAAAPALRPIHGAVLVGLAGLALLPLLNTPVPLAPPPTDTLSATVADPAGVLVDGAAKVDSARQLIEHARHRVMLETNALSGAPGAAIARAIAERAPHLQTARVLVDRAAYRRSAENRTWVDFLRNHGVDVRLSSAPQRSNVLLVDDDVAQVSGTGFTAHPAHDVGLVLEGTPAARFHALWDADWAGRTAPPSDAASGPFRVLDARASRERLLTLIRHARRSIRMEMHGLSDPEVIQALKDAQNRGVEVNVLLNRTASVLDFHAGDVNNMPAALAFSDNTEPLPMRWYNGPLETRMATFDESDVVLGSTDLDGNDAAHAVDVETDLPTVAHALDNQFFTDWQDHGTYAPVLPPASWRQAP